MSRKIIVHVAVSADGFIARRDGAFDWLDRPHPKHNYGMDGFYQSIDTILWGRRTCDMALDFQKRGVAGAAFDTRVNNYVFTHTLPTEPPPASVQFIDRPIKEFAAELRSQPGKDVWIMGGAGIIGSFLDAGEVDEFLLTVIPVFIGEGIPLMAPRQRTVELKLIASKAFEDGVVTLHYSVQR